MNEKMEVKSACLFVFLVLLEEKIKFKAKKYRKSLVCNKKAVSLHRQKRNGWFC
jgi:hypothetical protein